MTTPIPQTTPPSDLVRAFWMLVFLFNISLLAVTLGILLILFRNYLLLGGALLFLGLATGFLGYQRYTHYRYDHTFTQEPE
jgi:hypothetical protein